MKNEPTILYAGTYERSYPRNQQMIRLLRNAGCTVREVHEPFWEHIQDKSRSFRGPGAILLGALSLAWAYTRLMGRVLAAIRRSDALVIGYIGQLDMLTIGLLGRISGRPVIFNPLVTLTDTVVEDRTLVSPSSIPARLIWLIDWISLRLASVVITDTQANVNFLSERFGLSRSRVDVLFVGADEGVFHDAQRTGTDNLTIDVLFYGKMIPLHGIETILRAVQQLGQSSPEQFRFEIIGSGQEQDRVLEFLRLNPGCQITYRPRVAYRRLPQRIATADVVLGIFGSSEKSARVVPNKVFQAMAVGAPIITRDSPAIREVLDDESALLIPSGDSDALCTALEQLRNPDDRQRLGRNARSAFERSGRDDIQVQRLRNILTRQGLTGRSA